MNNIVKFIPKNDLSKIKNLDEFINFCKNDLTLWSDIPGWEWDNIVWPTHTKSRPIGFMNWENRNPTRTSNITNEMAMGKSIQDIAKAYIRYRHTISPHANVAREVIAFRVIDATLKMDNITGEIAKFNEKHLNNCFELLAVYKARPIYASALVEVLRRLSDLSIVSAKARFWNHPFVGAASYSGINGAKATSEKKTEKLPDQNALLSLADIFSKGYEPNRLDEIDIMVTSIVALMLCTPMRVAEVLRLRINCLKEDVDKNGQTQYYINYWSPKIGSYAKKAIPASMAPIALEAVNRLLKITNEARKLAKFYETNPSTFYRHDKCPDVGDHDRLNAHQVASCLGAKSVKSFANLFKNQRGKSGIKGLTLSKIWKEIILPQHHKLNPYFPYQEDIRNLAVTPPKMSECLLCFFSSQFSQEKQTSPILLKSFVITQLTGRLGFIEGGDKNSRRMVSIFTKHGYGGIRLKSHSLRHFLNHLAYHSGVQVELITEWSSRASVAQTFVYVDDSHYLETKARAREIVPALNERKYLPPVEDGIDNISNGPYQRTIYGLCLRSWPAGPCNKTFDCLNCSELLMCKGDKVALETVIEERKNLQITYNSAQTALESGERTATRWLKIARPNLDKLIQLEEILTSRDIPEGSPIRVAGCNDFSPEQAILQERVKGAGLELFDKSSLGDSLSSQIIKELEQLTIKGRN